MLNWLQLGPQDPARTLGFSVSGLFPQSVRIFQKADDSLSPPLGLLGLTQSKPRFSGDEILDRCWVAKNWWKEIHASFRELEILFQGEYHVLPAPVLGQHPTDQWELNWWRLGFTGRLFFGGTKIPNRERCQAPTLLHVVYCHEAFPLGKTKDLHLE